MTYDVMKRRALGTCDVMKRSTHDVFGVCYGETVSSSNVSSELSTFRLHGKENKYVNLLVGTCMYTYSFLPRS